MSQMINTSLSAPQEPSALPRADARLEPAVVDALVSQVEANAHREPVVLALEAVGEPEAPHTAGPATAPEPAVLALEAVAEPLAPPAEAAGAMVVDADDQEIVDQAAAMANFGSVFENNVRRSSRARRPTDYYVHPDHFEVILEGEDVEDVLADFDADSAAEDAMDTETDSDSDYEDY